ncbi:MAG: BREX-2 system adenine-specific DNA-methyltransferase PglX [Vicinamibacterales bacterium]
MKPNDRVRLTSALRDHVGKIAVDMRAKMFAAGDTRVRARQLHADEQVAEDFDVWTDLLSRRAAVLWVLKSVYVRVLEDRGLLNPGRLLDHEAQQLFERIAPHLGETAFLRWLYRDLASPRGGLPELFSPQPAEVALPSDELSRGLIAFWRHRDADTGSHWSFAEERFDGELMGDLYQELDPVVKDRFALCQTPDFVRTFILDRTLTPAIETFGAEEVRLLDPACGSGHFLIDGLKRVVAATAAKRPDWKREEVVAQALNRVVGVDLNDYACALARARLIMTAAELAGVTSLADAGRFHPHVYWADGLEQVERVDLKRSVQFSLLERVEEKPRATLTRSDVRTALRKMFATKFHAVVANPPYIVEGDDARKNYHRERFGRRQRYVSAYRQYSLGSPFTERCFQLAEKEGFVGIITSNNFMKREFGKPLIEDVLAGLDLRLVVDTSQAFIPYHDTPTVLLFGRNRSPRDRTIHAVMGKRGDIGTPAIPAQGSVWRDIASHWSEPTYESEYISVADVPRDVLSKHPWSLGGGGAGDLRAAMESAAHTTLGVTAREVGAGVLTRADEVFLWEPGSLRTRIPSEYVRGYVAGDDVRDWTVVPTTDAVFPYTGDGRSLSSTPVSIESQLWRWRASLESRVAFGKTQIERGLPWHEYSMLFTERLCRGLLITFSNVASHNHFALQRDPWLNNAHAPVITLPAEAKEDEYLALCAVLNSSVACFWMKQVFFPKGSATHDVSKDGLRPENNTYEFATTGLLKFPLPANWTSDDLVRCARELDRLGAERMALTPRRILSDRRTLVSARELRTALSIAELKDSDALGLMVYWQEELDWLCYRLFGLIPQPDGDDEIPRAVSVPEDARPFRGASVAVEARLPENIRTRYDRRRRLIDASHNLQLIETPVYKRLWRGRQGIFGRYDRTYREKTETSIREWLLERIEAAVFDRSRPFTSDQIVAELQSSSEVQAVCEVLFDRQDYSLVAAVRDLLSGNVVPSHAAHVYKPSGLIKRAAWERHWRKPDGVVPSAFAGGDFLKPQYWKWRGKLDVPKERFVAFTEVPGRSGTASLYGWAGWSSVQRLKAILATDEELEDAAVPLADRIGLLDSAWRLLPGVAREDASAAARLKAELQSIVGPEGPSPELVEDWQKRFPAPTARASGAKRSAATRVEPQSENKETD